MKFNEVLKNILVYEPGKPIDLIVREFGIEEKDIIKLASNENPFGTSELVINSIKNAASFAFRYPDDSAFEFKAKLGDKFGVDRKNIIIGAGSDQILELVSRALLNENSAILQAGATFAMYEVYASHVGAKVIKTNCLHHDLNEFKQILSKNDEIKVIYLCVPNNPLGECLSKDEVYEFISCVSKDKLVVVDGAYQEFASYKNSKMKLDAKDLINTFSNVIYVGTFSKLYALAGLRIGYAISNEELILNLDKLRASFNVSNLSIAAATAALNDNEFIDRTLKNNIEELKRYEEFAIQNGIEFIDSFTNFITFKLKKDSTKICDELLKRGIIIRNLKSYGLNGIRITIGTSEQNLKVLKELKELI